MTYTTFSLSEPSQSSIFLADVTVVDHAYIDDKGCVVGGSFHPCFLVTGVPDPVEKVVVDFSTVKHDIKEAIDRHSFNLDDNGFDHKLWVIEGYSLVDTLHIFRDAEDANPSVRITTPYLDVHLPTDAVKFVVPSTDMTPSYANEYIGAAFAAHVEEHLRSLYPQVNISVTCVNTTTVHAPTDALRQNAKQFTYVHGLKDSTSYGCNNIAHGHRSFISADTNPDDILGTIAAELDNTVFIRSDNITGHFVRGGYLVDVSLHYATPARGDFSMVIDTTAHKVTILSTETTVEYLAAYVKAVYGERLKSRGITEFYISEGLSKGAVETL